MMEASSILAFASKGTSITYLSREALKYKRVGFPGSIGRRSSFMHLTKVQPRSRGFFLLFKDLSSFA